MGSRPIRAALIVAAAAWAAQPGDERLARIRAQIAENLARLPNYTCTETIQRWRVGELCPGCESMDRLRLEVAVVGNRERFAWPGASRFEDKEPGDLAAPGATVTGDFAGFVRCVFITDGASYARAGEEKLGRRRALRYDYRVSPEHSSFALGVGKDRPHVPYTGSFWVDADTLDLIRLEIRAEQIPARLEIEEAGLAIDYTRARIGASEFLLPRSTDLLIVHRSGRRSRNRTQYSGCRQYLGESTIRFSEAPPEAAPVAPIPQPVAERRLPPGLWIEAGLEKGLNLGECAAGDPVSAVVTQAVKRNKEVIVPKGAVLRGRITRLERFQRPRPSTWVGFVFPSLEFDGTRVEFRARFREVRSIVARPNRVFFRPVPGPEAAFLIYGAQSELPKGFRLSWETVQDTP